ncbi:subtilisin-like protein [Myriangium duriaei CBS 260.36]|uniref:Subtilisin-like protein n=1 Tax=Myriangium duriaei CBS 260.36 TaxID=1168546 RepID=A0A9P4IZG3_9PEZI|nr:subtilisin-like protein [Myriangium duriaei CBS 260.36]
MNFLAIALSTILAGVPVVDSWSAGQSYLKSSDRYIVLLKPNIDVAEHLQNINTTVSAITHTYSLNDFQAYAGQFDRSVAEYLKDHHDVDHIETIRTWSTPELKDTPCVATTCTKQRERSNRPRGSRLVAQHCAPFNLQEISHMKDDGKKTYWYTESAGSGTFAYIVDSGIEAKHAEFEDRATLGFNAWGKSTPDKDEVSRGTYYASIIGGRKYGVAKRTSLIGVKVTKDGSATMTSILDGFQWAVKDIISKNRQSKSVIFTRFFSFDPSKPFDAIVNQAFREGIVTVISAGDHDDDASKGSPASSGKAITVGATNKDRGRRADSNFGRAVDIWAPGEKICAASSGGLETTMQFSGTTAAAAHVAGLVVYLQGSMKLSNPAAVKRAVIKLALNGVVKDAQSPANKFAYNGSGK